jgi:uncharacterized membrane protein
MSRMIRPFVLAISALLAVTFAAAETIITFDAVVGETRPYAINSSMQIVGTCFDVNRTARGFLRNADGTIVVFGPPGTYAVGINAAGYVVGSYRTRHGIPHGFVRKPNGRMISFDAGPNTVPLAISSTGQIIGILTMGSQAIGFLRRLDGTVVRIRVGESSTYPLAINEVGQIVGKYEDASGAHGFLRNPDGDIVTLDVGGAGTYPVAINDEGRIVGDYKDLNGDWHGFLREPSGSITIIDIIGSANDPSGINSAGVIAGGNVMTEHGFIRSRDGTIDLFVAGPDRTSIRAINTEGWVTGETGTETGIHAYLGKK